MKSKGIVKVRLRGGLGNQLFQIAAATCLAKACKVPMKVNCRELDNSSDPSKRNFLPMIILNDIFNFSQLHFSLVSETSLANSLYHRFGKVINGDEISKTVDLHRVIDSQTAAKYRLNGFFQELKFVEGSIRPNPKVTLVDVRPEVTKMCKTVKEENVITLHIRLGDFVVNGLDVLSKDYFNSAILEFVSERGNSDSKVLVFSDDIRAAQSMMHETHELIFPEMICPLSPAELLYVLSESRSLVLSKSTLAWWAGYLGHLNGNRIWSPWPKQFDIAQGI